MTPEFKSFPKVPRLFRDVVISEKVDGTNACVIVADDGRVFAQSRKRLVFPESDNFGFAAWVEAHADELRELGPGYHFGEWYGRGIQRGYGLDEKRFALFIADKYPDDTRPACCEVVPVLTRHQFSEATVRSCLRALQAHGSAIAPGYRNPEGIVVYHGASGQVFKVLLENDEIPKGLAA